MKVMLTVSADQNTHLLVNGRITNHRKRSFEWSSNWKFKESSSPTGWLKKCLELNGYETVFSNWTVNACRYRNVSLPSQNTFFSFLFDMIN